MNRRSSSLGVVAGAALALWVSAQDRPVPDVRLFFEAASQDEKAARAAMESLARSWHDGYTGMILDLARFMRSPRPLGPDEGERDGGEGLGDEGESPRGGSGRGFGPPAGSPRAPHPSVVVRTRLLRFLEKQTGQRFGDDLRGWRRWLWNQAYDPHPELASFKSLVYGRVDPRMAAFFPPGTRSLIRLDEVDWGGVMVNGIPPLDHPKHVAAAEATYLKDKNVVFGISLNGEARAYPKRILAWHEMALDRVGGVELTVVYCTLCGTVVPYGSEVGGKLRRFGTSGLLYRSNKLMFDHESLSLWSTSEGRPVVGSLAGAALELEAYPVVTTTWREWLARHPETTVLSLDTGYERDYDEGEAYRDYFSTDRVMFEVPRLDTRLKNKAEVLTLLLRPAGAEGAGERRALALSADFLKKNPLHERSVAGRQLVFLTSPDGANRVYESGSVSFSRMLGDGRVEDSGGGVWRVEEDALFPLAQGGAPLPRVAARRAFWFGWYAQFPETELVK